MNIYNKRKVQPLIELLKLVREDAFFDSAGRLFQSLAPRKEKHFCPLADFFFGNLKSVSVLRRLREEHCEFLVKRLHRYCGASSLRDLKTMIPINPHNPQQSPSIKHTSKKIKQLKGREELLARLKIRLLSDVGCCLDQNWQGC